jgi:Xaa-Pro aminopeptidase
MQRKTLLRKQLNKFGVDGILITDLLNVRYLSGFTGSSGYIIITPEKSLFLTDFRYQEQASDQISGFKIIIEDSERSQEIKQVCDKFGVRKLGFEDNHVTYAFYQKLLKRKIKLKPVNGAVESFRIVKSEAEKMLIIKAIKRAESAFRKLLPHIRPGVTEHKLAMQLEELIRREGCKSLPFSAIVASGPMSALPHARPSHRRLQKGDLVVFDWGGECEGYYSDMTRTILIKSNNISRQKELYYTVLEAQKRAIKSVMAGIKSARIDAAARDYINYEGYEDFFGHGTGHGVGLAVHEKPVVSWRNKEVIKENMIFTVEPGIYLPGFGGVRIEDMVAAGKKKADILTLLPKKLKIIER